MVDNKFPLIEKARAWFHRQPSAQQKNIKKYGTISVFVLGALGIYYMTGQDKKKPVEPPKQEDVTQAKTDSYIQDDIVSSLGGKIQNLESNIDGKVKDAVAEAVQKGQFSLTPPPPASSMGSTPVDAQGAPNTTGTAAAGEGTADYPGMNSYPTPSAYNDPSAQTGSADAAAGEEPSVVWVGGISDG
ncbi:conjugal transfer protein TraB, partial [Escherichia coli]|nr:conjugal transfer protein TraB [Escherichia coli]